MKYETLISHWNIVFNEINMSINVDWHFIYLLIFMEIYLNKGIKHTLQFQKAKLFVVQSHLYKLHWQVGINFIDRLSLLEECHVKNYDYGNRKKKRVHSGQKPNACP